MDKNSARIDKIEIHEQKISFYICESGDSARKNKYVIVEKAPYKKDDGLEFAETERGVPIIEYKEGDKSYQLSIERFENGMDPFL